MSRGRVDIEQVSMAGWIACGEPSGTAQPAEALRGSRIDSAELQAIVPPPPSPPPPHAASAGTLTLGHDPAPSRYPRDEGTPPAFAPRNAWALRYEAGPL